MFAITEHVKFPCEYNTLHEWMGGYVGAIHILYTREWCTL